jgi:hypothetical protein
MIDLQSPLTSAIAYWEPRRLLYNAWLLAIVVATWLRRRWMLLAIGMLFAAVPAHFISRGLFSAGAA